MPAPLLAAHDLAGPWRLPANRRAALLEEAAAGAFTVNTVADNAPDARAWLAALGAHLGFPAHFGANFDALYDCLCDREILPDPVRILLIDDLRGLSPDEIDTLIAVLQAAADEWREEGRALWALFSAPDLELDPLPTARPR